MFLKKNKTRSIGEHLALGYGLVILLSSVAISSILYFAISQDLARTLKDFLKREFQVTVSQAEKEIMNRSALTDLLARHTFALESPYQLGYAVFDAEGLVLAKSEGFREDEAVVEKIKQVTLTKRAGDTHQPYLTEINAGRGKKFYLATQMITGQTGEFMFLQLGVDDQNIRRTLGVVLKSIFVTLPAVLFLAFLGGYFMTKRALRPIGDLTRAAKELSIRNLKKELPVRGTGDELDELAETFNDVFKRLHEAYEKIVQFTADASHELRLPLAAIRGEAEVILGRERNLEEYQEVLGRILEEFERLSRMIEQLLALARTDTETEAPPREDVHLGGLLEKLVEFYKPLAEDKSVALSLEGDKDAMMPGETTRLEQLFSNLIDNAIKYTRSNGRVTVKLGDKDNEIEVRVIDTGIGIPKDEQRRIFERFYRVEKSRSREQGGAGLGLSIAEAIARAHGGRIAVESTPGHGSTFIVTFSLL